MKLFLMQHAFPHSHSHILTYTCKRCENSVCS